MILISTGDAPTAAETALAPIQDLTEERDVSIGADARPVLLGSECTVCRVSMFGRRQVCSKCGVGLVRPVELGPDGILYAFTTVHTGSAGPRVYGYVDVAGGARVFGTVSAPAENLRCDQAVTLELDGDQWCFRPI